MPKIQRKYIFLILINRLSQIFSRSQVVFLFHHPKILYPLVGQSFQQKFPNPYRSSQLQKCSSICLPFPNLFRPKYLEFGSKSLEDQSLQCCLTLLFYSCLFGVSNLMKKPYEVWCVAQEYYYFQHLCSALVSLVCHIGP